VWTLAAVFVVTFLVSRWRFEEDHGKAVIAAAVGCGTAYIAFMVVYVVPMYLGRWQADVAVGRQALSLAEGLGQTLARCVVATDWARWAQEAAWLTPYFTLAVWISIALAHTPPLSGRIRNPSSERRQGSGNQKR
jgi:hypothetical protein